MGTVISYRQCASVPAHGASSILMSHAVGAMSPCVPYKPMAGRRRIVLFFVICFRYQAVSE